MLRLLFLAFLIVPVIEIALFILLGQAIGLVPTLLGIVVTALIGSVVIRAQGISLVQEIREMMARGQMPARQIGDGVMLAISGALLMTPGYFTDVIGFLLLVPTIRTAIYSFLSARIHLVATSGTHSSYTYRTNSHPRQDDGVIDLDETDWHSEDDKRS